MAAGAQLEAICRESWGGQPPSGAFVDHEPHRLTVHHTAVVFDDVREGPARVRQHQRYHQDNGFPDLAYHFIVDGGGHVYVGRPTTAAGDTFTDYDPTGHVLVTAEGNFDDQALPHAQFAALVDLLAWASATFGVAPEDIAGHRDYASTSCPGSAINALLDDGSLQARVLERLDSGGVALVDLCGEAGATRVAAIESGTA